MTTELKTLQALERIASALESLDKNGINCYVTEVI